ncbi:MAG: MBOAT family O-acyltransferase [Mangrovibacterium sp.]
MKDQVANILQQILHYNAASPLFFTELAFWVLLVFILFIYSFLYRQNRLRNIYLLAFSWFIYYQMNGAFLIMLIISCFFNYSFGMIIDKSQKKKLWLSMGVILNLSLLAYYKYAAFFTDIVNRFSGSNYEVYDWIGSFFEQIFHITTTNHSIVLPIGISFYTFQAIGYLVDVKQEKVSVVKNPLDFAFFLSFFPQLVAGPIVRAAAFIPQLYQSYKLREEEFSHALFLIFKGLFKKMVIADFLTLNLIDRVFDAPWAYSGLENLASIYAYAIQIYCDFSGYTDIAIGLALILGFKIPINFNSPYQATSLTDFWKRWHISLSRWLRDYLYIPLGGNRKGEFRTYINLMLTMLLGGLWHGAHWRFVIWGAIHGLGLCIERLFSSTKSKRKKQSRVSVLIRQVITFHVVCFAWIFFRANDIDSILRMLYQIQANFIPPFTSDEWLLFLPTGIVLLVGFVIITVPIQAKESIRGWFIRQHWLLKSLLSLIIILLIQQVSQMGSQPFIYFRF